MRHIGLDIGKRRIGVAVSDVSGTLARPLTTITGFASTPHAVRLIADAIREIEADGDPISAIVVGVPRHLDGRPHALADEVRLFAQHLQRAVNIPIAFEDERLSSHEADSRLAARERDWRKRKTMLDAAAAAVILQDYLDRIEHS